METATYSEKNHGMFALLDLESSLTDISTHSQCITYRSGVVRFMCRYHLSSGLLHSWRASSADIAASATVFAGFKCFGCHADELCPCCAMRCRRDDSDATAFLMLAETLA